MNVEIGMIQIDARVNDKHDIGTIVRFATLDACDTPRDFLSLLEESAARIIAIFVGMPSNN
jgi:hypothetical protein